jgi:hypothetical protein
VHSHSGQGSEFEVLLPAPPGPLALPPAPAPAKLAGADAGGRLARKT